MAASFGTEEFRIDTSQVELVRKHVNKVERLFSVKVALDANGGDGNQWLVVSGNKENRKKATKYIQAMCNPAQTMCLKVSSRPSLDDAVLEDAERASNSFIQRTGSLTLQVSGSELQCALAVSCLEQTYRVMVPSIQAAEQDTDAPPVEVVSGVKDMAVDSSDSPRTHSVEDSQLFGSGRSAPSGTSPLLPQAAQNIAHGHTPARTCAGTSSMPAGVAPSPPAVALDSSTTAGRERAGADSSQMGRGSQGQTVTQLTPQQRSEVEDRLGSGEESERQAGEVTAEALKQKSELQSLGLGMGYTQREIEDTFNFFDFTQSKVELPEFLTVLDEVRANGMKEEREGGRPLRTGAGSKRSPQGPAPGGKPRAERGKPGRKADVTPPGGRKPSTGGNPGKSPASPVTLSPHKCSPLADRSVIVVGDDGNNSVIFMGEEADDSVHLIDLQTFASAGTSRPPAKFQHPSAGAARKRKDYSDDEDQTKVLKPYLPSPDKGVVDRLNRVQESTAGTGSAASDLAVPGSSHPAAATSCGVAANKDSSDLRFIVIDGSNVAMTHGNDKTFSCRGIQICVDFFVRRGHRVKAWVPLTKTYQRQPGHMAPVVNQEILEELKDQGYLGYTPARTLNARHIVSHDDPFILDLAAREDAVVVSNDNFREFVDEFRFIIENRVLSYVFSDDHFMLPRDPLGRNGPPLGQFLRKSPVSVPNRTAAEGTAQRQPPPSVASASSQGAAGQGPASQSRPAFHPARQRQTAFGAHSGARQVAGRNLLFPQPGKEGWPRGPSAGLGGVPPRPAAVVPPARQAAVVPPARQAAVVPPARQAAAAAANTRHDNVTEQLFEALKMVFPEKEQEAKIQQVLDNHCAETDLNKLTNYCIAALNL